MLFENFNQLYPYADAALAVDVKQKDAFGFHDVQVGNEPNAHLAHFLQQTMPENAEEYRDRFDRYRDLLGQFAVGELGYAGFAARVRRREQGAHEDSDHPPDDEDHPDPNELYEDWE
jgi:hypothetical protein